MDMRLHTELVEVDMVSLLLMDLITLLLRIVILLSEQIQLVTITVCIYQILPIIPLSTIIPSGLMVLLPIMGLELMLLQLILLLTIILLLPKGVGLIILESTFLKGLAVMLH